MSEYKQLMERQRRFFAAGKTRNIEFRMEQLKKLRRVVIEKHREIEASLYRDLRKCEFEAFATEVTAMIDEIDCAVENLASWTKPVDVDTPPLFGQAESTIYYEPYGSVLILNTWNYPFVLCFKPLVGALAAGNCCVVKPSEVAPAASGVLADIVNTAFDAEYCFATEGGVEVATELLKERFDFILYTGSAKVGRIVARAAAEYLTPTALELGGKSPCIVDQSADIERSVASICWGKFINAGQTCVAPDYVWVHREVKDRLVDALKNQISAFYGEAIERNADFGRIINSRHFERLRDLLKESRIVFGGETDESQRFVSPTIVDGVTWESKIMQEEVFGPILPVMTFESIGEVVDTLAGGEKPLALYLYTTDKEVERLIIHRVPYGGGCINATLLHMLNTNLPFGGVGSSGYGFYQGRWSIETFSHRKCILRKALSDEPSPLFPPYADRAEMLKRIYLGAFYAHK
jgi:aldehyde dehydrogenase (NAD+)